MAVSWSADDGPAGTRAGRSQNGRPRRILVDAGGLDRNPWTALRLGLLADVLRRAIQEHLGCRAAVVVVPGPKPPRHTNSELTRALMIEEPLAVVGSHDEAVEALAGPPDVVVTHGARPITPPPPFVVGAQASALSEGGSVDAVLERCADPLAVRLALLRFPPTTPAALSLARLHRADETLQRWRFKVAGWADMPTGPSMGGDSARRELLPGLDTGRILTLLHRVEIDPRIASGSKFASFARHDQVLGLDLCRIVLGRYRR